MNNHCVCISGSTQGIGYGIAEAFAKKGARIVINSHLDDNDALDKLNKITECYFVKSDLSTVEGAEYFVENHTNYLVISIHGKNAGTFKTLVLKISQENFEKLLI